LDAIALPRNMSAAIPTSCSVDLTLSLSIGPIRSYCCATRRFILCDASGKRDDETSAGALDPCVETLLSLADHQVESGDDLAGFDEGW
jgi:hypothetical protein